MSARASEHVRIAEELSQLSLRLVRQAQQTIDLERQLRDAEDLIGRLKREIADELEMRGQLERQVKELGGDA